jgi:hypothetical protein
VASDVGVAVMVYEWLSLCSLGCGWLGRAALWLELERWYVGTAVPEGGAGGVVEQLDIGAEALKALSVECIETFYRVGDEFVSMMIIDVVWRSSSGGLASSSSLERLVFACS